MVSIHGPAASHGAAAGPVKLSGIIKPARHTAAGMIVLFLASRCVSLAWWIPQML